MNFGQLLTAIMVFLSDNLVGPIETFLVDQGYDVLGLRQLDISFGFGNITWFALNLGDLIMLGIALMVSITAFVFTWKFLKMLTRFVYRMFGGIRK